MKYKIDQYKQLNALPGEILLVCAATGISAFAAGGATLHKIFKLNFTNPNSFYLRLQKKDVNNARVKQNFARIIFIIIEEYSLVGIRYIRYVDEFLKKVCPDMAHLPFAGKHLYFVGDEHQLPPVLDVPIYYPLDKLESSLKPLAQFYRDIKKIYKLTEPKRQNIQDPQQAAYNEFLKRLRHDCCTPEDVQNIRSRRKCMLPAHVVKTFEYATHVFPWNKDVNKHNK